MSTKKIKILFRLRSMEMGGVQKVLLNILNNLDRNKFEISLLVNIYQGELIKKLPTDINIQYIVKGKEFFSKNPIIHKFQLVLRRIKLEFFGKFSSVLYKTRKINDQDIEIAFTHYSFKEVLKSPNKKAKKIGWMHGDIKNVTIVGDKKKFVSYFLKFDKMIYVSRQTLESAKTFNSELEKNAAIIYNPIDTEEIITKSKEKINNKQVISSRIDGIPSFISIGRVTPVKGYHLLLRVHKKLIDNGLFHRIYIIGEGYSKAELVRNVKELKLDKSFIFLGKKENPYPYIKKIDYFILPSFSEAYPLVIAESLILEKPVITTDVGGIREMMEHEKNGIFVQSEEEEELYNAMKSFIIDKEKTKIFSENNKKYKEYFNPDKVYRQIEKLLLEIL